MKKLFVVILGLAQLSLLSADSLWDEAVEIFSEYRDLTPGRMEIHFEQYNGRGKLVSTDETELLMWSDENGETTSRIVFARHNGEDVTEDRREDPDSGRPSFTGNGDGDENGAFAGLQRSPFDPQEQSNVSVSVNDGLEVADGTEVRSFEFRHATGPDTYTAGTAWLDAESGEPVRLQLTIAPLPRFVDSFSMRQEFGRDEEGRWITRRLEFDGEGSFLFFRRRIESRLIFSEYFLAQQGPVY